MGGRRTLIISRRGYFGMRMGMSRDSEDRDDVKGCLRQSGCLYMVETWESMSSTFLSAFLRTEFRISLQGSNIDGFQVVQ